MLTVEVLMEHSNGSVLVSAEDDMLDKPREIPAKVGLVVQFSSVQGLGVPVLISLITCATIVHFVSKPQSRTILRGRVVDIREPCTTMPQTRDPKRKSKMRLRSRLRYIPAFDTLQNSKTTHLSRMRTR